MKSNYCYIALQVAIQVLYYVSARGVGVSFGAGRKRVVVVTANKAIDSFLTSVGSGVLCLSWALAGWQVLVSVLSDLELGLGTRRKGPMELSWLKFFCAHACT